ncbi:MAG: hypothetical protein JOZ96_06585 [Acidobacteria bacterium]|nr:hypothetical protein [Acidobacteriota bacterium]
MIHEWWSDRSDERFWLEVTQRTDLGANLKAPQTNEQGNEFWSYSLLKYVRPGDIIFHYHRLEQAIVALSAAVGEVWEDDIVWAARGTSARTAGIHPHPRHGWYIGLERFSTLEQVVRLEQIRDEQSAMIEMRDKLAALAGEPLYFPFELGQRRPLRPMQGYLFKLPRFFVERFPDLTKGVALGAFAPVARVVQKLGNSYRPADEATAVGQRDPFSVDPALVERGLRGHAFTQNALAKYLREHGLDPRSPRPDEPNFDLAWVNQDVSWIAEVKSLTKANEEKQLRLGLGQLLRYRQVLSLQGPVRAVLVAERQPTDDTWDLLCQELNIMLLWPGNWDKKLP